MNHAQFSARLLLLGWLLATNRSSFAKPASLKLAETGRALQSVVISARASGAIRTNALELAEYLARFVRMLRTFTGRNWPVAT